MVMAISKTMFFRRSAFFQLKEYLYTEYSVDMSCPSLFVKDKLSKDVDFVIATDLGLAFFNFALLYMKDLSSPAVRTPLND